MRITQRAIAATSLQGLNSNLRAVNGLQQQLTSGKMISRPSDSPTGTNTSLLARQDIGAAAQHARNISDGKTVLDQTDSALQDMLEQVRRVRDLTLQAMNGGAVSPESRGAVATELRGLRESLLGQANQVVQGRPLFGGVSSGTQAYDVNGAYVGVGGANGIPVTEVTRRVSDVEVIRVDLTGPEAFGDPASGKDLFAVVRSIAGHVDDTGQLAADLGDLDAVMSRMLGAVADVGTRQSRMDTADEVNSNRQLALASLLADTEDVDMPKTIMELNMRQTGYQAALQATAQSIQPTLLDFLR